MKRLVLLVFLIWALIAPKSVSSGQPVKTLIFPMLALAQSECPDPPECWFQYPYAEGIINKFQVALALANYGDNQATIKLSARQEDGSLLQGAGIVNPVSVILPRRNQIARYACQFFGQGIWGKKAYIEAEITGGDVAGFYHMFDDGFNFLSGDAAIPKEYASTRVLLAVAKDYAFAGEYDRTLFSIINPNDVEAHVKLFFGTKENGVTGSGLGFTISPRGQLQKNFTPNFDGYFDIFSDIPIVASEVFLKTTYKFQLRWTITSIFTIMALNGINASEAVTKAGEIKVNPRVTTAPGWFTNLILWDTGHYKDRTGAAIMSWITIRDNGGNKVWEGDPSYPDLEPGQMQIIDARKLLKRSGLSGSLDYQTDQDRFPLSVTQGLLVLEQYGDTFIYEGQEYPAGWFLAMVRPMPPIKYARFSHVAVGDTGIGFFDTGIAVRNLSGYRNNFATLSLFDSTGKPVSSKTLEILPNGEISLTCGQIFGKVFPMFSGFIEIRGTEEFKSLAAYWIIRNGKTIAVSMIPQQ